MKQPHIEALKDYEIIVKKIYDMPDHPYKTQGKLTKETFVLKNQKVVAVFKNKGDAVKFIKEQNRPK